MYARIRTSREIGEKIKKRRKELGITQEELAERLSVTYQQVQRYENGKNRLNVENIQVIADTLNVPVSYFFGDTDRDKVSENRVSYLSADENRLLNYFRRIGNKKAREIVLQLVRLIARTGG